MANTNYCNCLFWPIWIIAEYLANMDYSWIFGLYWLQLNLGQYGLQLNTAILIMGEFWPILFILDMYKSTWNIRHVKKCLHRIGRRYKPFFNIFSNNTIVMFIFGNTPVKRIFEFKSCHKIIFSKSYVYSSFCKLLTVWTLILQRDTSQRGGKFIIYTLPLLYNSKWKPYNMCISIKIYIVITFIESLLK